MRYKIDKSKFQELITDSLNKKTVLVYLAFAILLVYINPVKHYYDETVVAKVLSKVESNYLTDTVFLLTSFLFLLVIIYSVIKKKRIQNWPFFLFAFFFLLFVIERTSLGRYNFYNFCVWPSIKYCDILFLIFAGLLTLKVFNWRSKHAHPIDKDDPFIIDLPINGSHEDLYQRAQFAERLATKIQSKLNGAKSGSLAIGLNGIWGSGKSSFANLIKEKIDKENRIVIDFNPWRSSTPSKIIEDFFELLIAELGRYDSSLSKALANYAKTLTKIDENIFTKAIENLGDILFEETDKNENYELINKSIEKTKKQVIIFIDDLDRLEIKEIVEVLRLIRNTANFNRVVYVVSYDKGYVLEAVKQFNRFNFQYFLEKIFQFEFLIPRYDLAILRNALKQILNVKLGNEFTPVINSAVDFRSISGKSLSNRVIITHRDIIRFSNSLLFEISQVKHDVNFIDFFLIQLLKIKFPDIYKLVADNHDLFFIIEKSSIRLRTIEEKGLGEKYSEFFGFEEERKNPSTNSETIFESYILNKAENLTQIERDTIIEIMNSVLDEKPLRENSVSKDYRSFSNASDFHKYFIFQTLETDFPIYDLEKNRVKDYPTYQKFVFDLIEKGRLSDIQDRLEKIMDFTDKTDWENHFKMLVDIGKYQIKSSKSPYGINYKQIIETLNYPVSKNNETLIFDNRDQYVTYVKDFFKNAPTPFVFESNILAAALTPVLSLVLEKKEIHQQLFNYFKQYCSNHTDITNEFRDLHRNAIKRKEGYHDEYETIEGAQELFVEYFRKYLKGSGLASFIQQFGPGVEKFHLAEDWLKVFFKSKSEFEDYLHNEPIIKIERECYDEFLAFYNKAKKQDYSAIEFEFVFLKPNRIIEY